MSRDGSMHVVACQLDIVWEEKPSNFRRVREMVSSAAPLRGSLVVLPEMFATGFTMEARRMAESKDGETVAFLRGLAVEFGVAVLAGVALRDEAGRVGNHAVVMGPDGGWLADYVKMQPFRLAGEERHYGAGERPTTFRWEGWEVAPWVCYDLRFPELFRAVTWRARPGLHVVIANWAPTRIGHWVRLLQARAVENQAYVVGVNRVGRDPQFDYNGRTLVVDPEGEIVADGGGEEGVVRAVLDRGALEDYRTRLPFLEDIRPDWVRRWE